MSVVLLVVGILVTGVGVVVVGFSIPINDLALGQSLIIAGAIALVGGPILIGLATAVSQLAQIAEALKGRPATRPAAPRPPPVVPALRADVAPQPRPVAEARRVEPRAPQPRPAEPVAPDLADATVAASASAIERLRSTMAPRPERAAIGGDVPAPSNGGQRAPERPEPRPGEPDAKEPRLDFLFRSRTPRLALQPTPAPQPQPQQENLDSLRPRRAVRGGAEPAPRPVEAPHEERRVLPRPAAAPAQERSVMILKSGVVDGMAYTVYADGSIEAQVPQGTLRFGSIAELRAHIEKTS